MSSPGRPHTSLWFHELCGAGSYRPSDQDFEWAADRPTPRRPAQGATETGRTREPAIPARMQTFAPEAGPTGPAGRAHSKPGCPLPAGSGRARPARCRPAGPAGVLIWVGRRRASPRGSRDRTAVAPPPRASTGSGGADPGRALRARVLVDT